MNQPSSQQPQTFDPSRLVLWTIAVDPLILAAVGYLVRSSAPPAALPDPKLDETLLVIFAVISLAAAWASFWFAARMASPTGPSGPPAERPLLVRPRQIAALALATVPGVLGLVHHLLFGVDWVLLAFNGGAFALAVRHVLSFANAPAPA